MNYVIQFVHTGQKCFLKNIILFLKCSFDVARLFFKNNVVAGFEPGTFAASVSVTAPYRYMVIHRCLAVCVVRPDWRTSWLLLVCVSRSAGFRGRAR
eukprot:SAG31_NODE_27947_length_417_cov_7.276730_1_plen_96_part_10